MWVRWWGREREGYKRRRTVPHPCAWTPHSRAPAGPGPSPLCSLPWPPPQCNTVWHTRPRLIICPATAALIDTHCHSCSIAPRQQSPHQHRCHHQSALHQRVHADSRAHHNDTRVIDAAQCPASSRPISVRCTSFDAPTRVSHMHRVCTPCQLSHTLHCTILCRTTRA